MVPVGPLRGDQELLVIRKQGEELVRKNLGSVRFVPMVRGGRDESLVPCTRSESGVQPEGPDAIVGEGC